MRASPRNSIDSWPTAALWFSSDTQSPDALTYTNRMQQVMTEIQNRILFFSLWWKGLDEEGAEALLPDAGAYPDYRHFLQEMRLFKPYMLEEEAERIINVKDANGMNAVIIIYTMLTNRLEFELEIDGAPQRMTRGEVMGLCLLTRSGHARRRLPVDP